MFTRRLFADIRIYHVGHGTQKEYNPLRRPFFVVLGRDGERAGKKKKEEVEVHLTVMQTFPRDSGIRSNFREFQAARGREITRGESEARGRYSIRNKGRPGI